MTHVVEVSLSELANEINREAEAAELAVRDALAHAIRGGEKLREAKHRLSWGEWGHWLRSNTKLSPTTATNWMRLAANRQQVADSSAATVRDALALLATPRSTVTPPGYKRLNPEAERALKEAHAQAAGEPEVPPETEPQDSPEATAAEPATVLHIVKRDHAVEHPSREARRLWKVRVDLARALESLRGAGVTLGVSQPTPNEAGGIRVVLTAIRDELERVEKALDESVTRDWNKGRAEELEGGGS